MSFAAGTSARPDLVSWAERIRQGDRSAEAALIQHFSRGVRAIVRSYCRPGETQVDDLTQEVLAVLLQRLRAGAIVDAQALPHYLRIAIQHSCTAHYRRLQRQDRDPERGDESDAGADPIHDLAASQRLNAMRQLLKDMPVARDREVLRRFYLLDQTRQTICSALQIDDQHFHRVIHRARTRLREALQRVGISRDD